jgi:FAD/FMN-containing dehydrogenase
MKTTNEESSHGIIWQNWSGGQVARPTEFFTPATEADLAERLEHTQGKVRVAGASHSFSPVVVTSSTLISLDRLSGLIRHDPALSRARAWAGTRLFELGDMLHAVNQGLVNQGDVDRQSLAGVVSTGTHGTGMTLGCLSAQVSGLTLVCADGTVLHCSATESPELFAAARVSLGAFGVLTQIEMQNRPAYRLSERARCVSPRGLSDQSAFGFSANQAALIGSRRTGLSVDDYVFLQPRQSEGMLLSFGDIATVRAGKLMDCWSPLPA